MSRASARLSAILVAALCAFTATAAETGGKVTLRLKLAPPEALVFLDGELLALDRAEDGIRPARLASGPHEMLIVADGYVARKVAIEAAEGAAAIELKLERSGSALAFIDSLPAGARPKSAAFSPYGEILVVPLLSGSGADVFDSTTLERIGSLTPPLKYAKFEGFVESAFFPGIGEVWVSQMYNSMIHVFDLETLAYKESFPSGGSYPKVIASSPDGERAYVTNWVSEDLTIFETRSRRLLARVELGGTPRGLAASEDGKYLYIARFLGGSILRLHLFDNALETLWSADGGAKRSIALDSSRGRLYATDMDRGSVFVLDSSTGRLLAEIPIGFNPNGLALSPDRRHVYACTRGPNGAAGYEKPGPVFGEIVSIDADALKVVDRQWGGNQPTGLAISLDGKRLVFTDFLDAGIEIYDILYPPQAISHQLRIVE